MSSSSTHTNAILVVVTSDEREDLIKTEDEDFPVTRLFPLHGHALNRSVPETPPILHFPLLPARGPTNRSPDPSAAGESIGAPLHPGSMTSPWLWMSVVCGVVVLLGENTTSCPRSPASEPRLHREHSGSIRRWGPERAPVPTATESRACVNRVQPEFECADPGPCL
ncbi:unnamed protein product [Pleuronectes platessa]|uniref:Uncharacterized protein n=1 Tax=Pleuronectes platessa TaxID=8262 RepID=A0A9N7TZV6_PLEPL|nr:unnamed protein product [Pleuronectes platessa]